MREPSVMSFETLLNRIFLHGVIACVEPEATTPIIFAADSASTSVSHSSSTIRTLPFRAAPTQHKWPLATGRT